jgi:ribonuclease HI
VSDGGLADHYGTFGWKIVKTNDDVVLYEGSGPIDGPTEVGSSTRSELGGFTAPLLLVTALARFWGLRHRCRFRWTTDSTSAIKKVKMYTKRSSHQLPQRYPEHSDYITTIRELCDELRRPLEIQWVKGHQDDDRAYDELPRDAKLNIDVDELATQHRQQRKVN